MKCPHCQHPLENPVTLLRRKRSRSGKCIDCGEVRRGDDVMYVRCDDCRRRAREHAKRRRVQGYP